MEIQELNRVASYAGDSTGVTTLTNAVWAPLGALLKSSRKFGSSSRILGYFPSMFRFFSVMSRNYRVFPWKISKCPIPGEISRFPEQFWLCPETAFVRVVTPRDSQELEGLGQSRTGAGRGCIGVFISHVVGTNRKHFSKGYCSPTLCLGVQASYSCQSESNNKQEFIKLKGWIPHIGLLTMIIPLAYSV